MQSSARLNEDIIYAIHCSNCGFTCRVPAFQVKTNNIVFEGIPLSSCPKCKKLTLTKKKVEDLTQ